MAKNKSPTVGESFGTSESSYTILRELLPAPAWIIRKHEPDFHIDYLIEPTEAGELSGINIGIQLKGWAPKKHKVGAPVYRLKTKHLLYYLEKCEFPVFLLLIDVTHRLGYWVFTQRFGSKLNHDQLRKQKKFTVPFSLQDTLADIPRFTKAVLDAMKFMRDLRPSSIDAAVSHKKRELEAKDPRVEVQIEMVNGRQNIILNAKQELAFTVGFNTSDPATLDSVKDFFEKGTDLEITRGEIEFNGSPLFEELQMPKNERLRIQYRRETDGHALFSWGENDPESYVYIPGKCRIGEKFLTFEGSLPNSPFKMTTSLPWTIAHTPEAFSMNLEFHPQLWQNQRLVALPHFESTHRYLKAIANGKEVILRLYSQGNLLGKSRVTEVDHQKFHGVLALLETVRKARVLARRFQVDPVLPSLKGISEEELMVIEELYAALYSKEYRRHVSGLKLSFPARKPHAEWDPDRSQLATFTQEIHGFKIFGLDVMVRSILPGLILAEVTQLKLTQMTPGEESGMFNFEFQSTEGSERVVRYGGPFRAAKTSHLSSACSGHSC
ncbi:MAG TPA: DUF4365 domain-containing protein [Verrucomicrobiae bacterium]|jgi:hypothetical protein|nr:DUF4365 domain-containing protein [Verrucomicrobiae bacterium]